MNITLAQAAIAIIPQAGWLKQQMFVRCRQMWCLVRALFPVCRSPSSHCVLTRWRAERGKASSVTSLQTRTLISFKEVYSQDLITSQRPYLLNTLQLGVRMSPYKLGAGGAQTFSTWHTDLSEVETWTIQHLLNYARKGIPGRRNSKYETLRQLLWTIGGIVQMARAGAVEGNT